MKQEDQLKTTSASRVLFSSARLWVRDRLLPFVQAETPMITQLQSKYRTPFLDKFFMTASFIGSHVFYMLFLPMCFWFGFARFGRLLTSLLATSLYVVNIVKDYLCLPRPTSPPVVKLSSDYKMEYGFPSAHAVNALNMAISTAMYYVMQSDPAPSWAAQVLAWTAAVSFIVLICVSRVYCGMHTVTDIVGGLVFGASLQYLWLSYYPYFDVWMTTNDNVLMYSIAFAVALLWLYPDPVDPTPSFDDAISFVWVVAGVASGTRMFTAHAFSDATHYLGNVRYSLDDVGLLKSVLRVAVGVAIVLSWRFVAKHVLRVFLPPLYRAHDFLPKRRNKHRKAAASSGDISVSPSFLNLRRLSDTLTGHRRSDSNGSSGSASDSDDKQYTFHRIPRFDVDVVSRCVVYFGIGWLACAGIPMVFEYVGLGPDVVA
eukprot:Unigene227_Nuclearia_a/m.829 Unigene227_Nuclearia_a/g.829  ORF Unigene227_Nuclearia_a/g.829 Unigene227_Nuclearia_a/m.829 type:complete len:429 (-) Unigene227_Nuclearia_a:55-1341(-)